MPRILSFLDAVFHVSPPNVPNDTHPQTTTRNVYVAIKSKLPGYTVTLEENPPYIKIQKPLKAVDENEYIEVKQKMLDAVNSTFKELYATDKSGA